MVLISTIFLMSCSFVYILTSTPPPTKLSPTIPSATFTPPIETKKPTITYQIMCTPPACAQNEVYFCEEACPSGCGTTCATQTPETPVTWWHLEPGLTFHIQYTSEMNLDQPVDVYNIDLFETPKETIDQLHVRGIKVICYFSAGTREDWRPDADQFPQEVRGAPLIDWPGERWLDIRQVDLISPIMAARLDLAATKGCDAVDPDNLDGYANDSGFGFTSTDQIAYNRWIANEAHARGLAIGLKNNIRLLSLLAPYFEFAVNEECFSYQECDSLEEFIEQDKAVFIIEYSEGAEKYCKIANAERFQLVIKKLELDAWNIPCWQP